MTQNRRRDAHAQPVLVEQKGWTDLDALGGFVGGHGWTGWDILAGVDDDAEQMRKTQRAQALLLLSEHAREILQGGSRKQASFGHASQCHQVVQSSLILEQGPFPYLQWAKVTLNLSLGEQVAF